MLALAWRKCRCFEAVNLGALPGFRKYGGLRAGCVRRCAKSPARGHAPRTLVGDDSMSLVNHDSTYSALAYGPVEIC
jgi:hypothetical protein